jgi:RecB family exonuclease
MDRQLGPVNHGEGLSWLREILSSHPFEPRSDSLQPIEILPLAQATGLPADHLFIIDACDDVLPAPRLRQPFLAIEALAEAGVPDATPPLALDTARRMANILAGSARHLTLSHVRCDERGAQKTPTTVFGADLEWREVRADEALTAAERTCRAGPLYALPDSDPVPAVSDPVAEGIFGGVAIFRDFVEAPFFAYCRYRLGIEPLPEPGPGLSASDQGRVIHAALESFWREIRSQDALKALADAQLLERIGAPLDHALAVQLPADRYGRRLRQLERARLLDVLRQWLQHERRREEPFEAIGFEHEVPLRFEGLDLTLRIDRVDRVSTVGGERLLILDYKTGRNADNKGWKSDSLTEPQLPLYATAATLGVLGITHVDGIAFGHIRDGHPAIVPCTNWRLRLIGEEPFKHIEDWDAHLAAWRERLTAIAHGFLAGEAGIDPEGDYERSFNAPLLGLLRDPP